MDSQYRQLIPEKSEYLEISRYLVDASQQKFASL